MRINIIREGCTVGFNRVSPIKQDRAAEEGGNLGIAVRVTGKEIYVAVSAGNDENSVLLDAEGKSTRIAFVKVTRDVATLLPEKMFPRASEQEIDLLKNALEQYERTFSFDG